MAEPSQKKTKTQTERTFLFMPSVNDVHHEAWLEIVEGSDAALETLVRLEPESNGDKPAAAKDNDEVTVSRVRNRYEPHWKQQERMREQIKEKQKKKREEKEEKEEKEEQEEQARRRAQAEWREVHDPWMQLLNM